MAHPFRSFAAKPTASSEADVIAAARQLLEEHAASREAATKAHNLVCGNCEGSGEAFSTIANGMTRCWACHGDGKPNDKIQSLPALDQADHERMWKIERLLRGPHSHAVLQLIKEYMPELYKKEGQAN